MPLESPLWAAVSQHPGDSFQAGVPHTGGGSCYGNRGRQEGQWNPGVDPNGWRGWRERREESRQAHECVPWNVDRTGCSFQTPCAVGELTRTAMSLSRPASLPLWVCPLVLCGSNSLRHSRRDAGSQHQRDSKAVSTVALPGRCL